MTRGRLDVDVDLGRLRGKRRQSAKQDEERDDCVQTCRSRFQNDGFSHGHGRPLL